MKRVSKTVALSQQTGAAARLKGRRPEDLALFQVELEADAGGKLPAEFQLFAAGLNRTTQGPFVFDGLSAESVMTHAREWGVDFMIDYGHASLGFLALDPAESGKAAGWFVPEVRGGALWATNVRWTEKGGERVRSKEYRYVSPAAHFEELSDGGRRITELINCALTNMPATIGAAPLVAAARAGDPSPQKESTMIPKFLLALLGLAENAGEADVTAALSRLKELPKTLFALTAKSDLDQALGVVAGWRAAAEQTATLSKELAELRASTEKAERERLIALAVTEGKLTPAQKPWAESLSVAQLAAFVETAPKAPEPKKEPAKPGVVLDAKAREIRRQIGVTDEAVEKTVQKEA